MRFAVVPRIIAENNDAMLAASTSHNAAQIRKTENEEYWFFSFAGEAPEVFKNACILSEKEVKHILAGNQEVLSVLLEI